MVGSIVTGIGVEIVIPRERSSQPAVIPSERRESRDLCADAGTRVEIPLSLRSIGMTIPDYAVMKTLV